MHLQALKGVNTSVQQHHMTQTDSVCSSRNKIPLKIPERFKSTWSGRQTNNCKTSFYSLQETTTLDSQSSSQSTWEKWAEEPLWLFPFCSTLNNIQTLGSTSTEQAHKCTFLPFTVLFSLQCFSTAFLLLLLSSFPPPFTPCYLFTRPWHLSLLSDAPSVALGWWMGWWTLSCHSNLMDGLATDTSTERVHHRVY